MLSSNKNTVLVTGASGLVGHHVSNLLLENNYKVYLQYNTTLPTTNHKNAFLLKADLTESLNTEEIGQIDVVVHCAAEIPKSFDDAGLKEVAEKNTKIDDTVISFCKTKSSRLIYFSSCSVYGNAKMPWSESTKVSPSNLYSLSKFNSEIKIAIELPNSLIFRISSPYGSGQKNKNVLLKFLECKANGENITLFSNGSRKQDFISASDIAFAVLCGIKSKETTGIFNIAAGKTISMLQLAESALNTSPKTKSAIILASEDDPQKDYDPIIEINKAIKFLKWQPKINIESGLQAMIFEFKNS